MEASDAYKLILYTKEKYNITKDINISKTVEAWSKELNGTYEQAVNALDKFPTMPKLAELNSAMRDIIPTYTETDWTRVFGREISDEEIEETLKEAHRKGIINYV